MRIITVEFDEWEFEAVIRGLLHYSESDAISNWDLFNIAKLTDRISNQLEKMESE